MDEGYPARAAQAPKARRKVLLRLKLDSIAADFQDGRPEIGGPDPIPSRA